MPEEQIKALRLGGILHDVGKIGIPDAILLKKGRLSPEEFDIMRSHPVIGANICAPLRSLKLVIPIIRHHHERYDGSGYPDHLKAEEIPITARILTVVDVYDALRTERPYKPAFDRQKSLEIMNEENGKGWYDPKCIEAFFQLELEEQ